MSTSVSKPNPNLAASNTTAAIVRQQPEVATQMGAYSSPAAVSEGNMSGMPKSKVPSIPTSLSQPEVQSAPPGHVSVILGDNISMENFSFTALVIRIRLNCCVGYFQLWIQF